MLTECGVFKQLMLLPSLRVTGQQASVTKGVSKQSQQKS